MTAIPEDISRAVTIGSVKAIAEQPAMLSNLAFSNIVATTNLSQQNAVANQQSMNELGIAVVAEAVNLIGSLREQKTHPATDGAGHPGT